MHAINQQLATDHNLNADLDQHQLFNRDMSGRRDQESPSAVLEDALRTGLSTNHAEKFTQILASVTSEKSVQNDTFDLVPGVEGGHQSALIEVGITKVATRSNAGSALAYESLRSPTLGASGVISTVDEEPSTINRKDRRSLAHELFDTANSRRESQDEPQLVSKLRNARMHSDREAAKQRVKNLSALSGSQLKLSKALAKNMEEQTRSNLLILESLRTSSLSKPGTSSATLGAELLSIQKNNVTLGNETLRKKTNTTQRTSLENSSRGHSQESAPGSSLPRLRKAIAAVNKERQAKIEKEAGRSAGSGGSIDSKDNNNNTYRMSRLDITGPDGISMIVGGRYVPPKYPNAAQEAQKCYFLRKPPGFSNFQIDQFEKFQSQQSLPKMPPVFDSSQKKLQHSDSQHNKSVLLYHGTDALNMHRKRGKISTSVTTKPRREIRSLRTNPYMGAMLSSASLRERFSSKNLQGMIERVQTTQDRQIASEESAEPTVDRLGEQQDSVFVGEAPDIVLDAVDSQMPSHTFGNDDQKTDEPMQKAKDNAQASSSMPATASKKNKLYLLGQSYKHVQSVQKKNSPSPALLQSASTTDRQPQIKVPHVASADAYQMNATKGASTLPSLPSSDYIHIDAARVEQFARHRRMRSQLAPQMLRQKTSATRVNEDMDEERKTEQERTITPSAHLNRSMGFSGGVDTRVLPRNGVAANLDKLNGDLIEAASSAQHAVPKTSHGAHAQQENKESQKVDQAVSAAPGASDTSSVFIKKDSTELAAKHTDHMLLADDSAVIELAERSSAGAAGFVPLNHLSRTAVNLEERVLVVKPEGQSGAQNLETNGGIQTTYSSPAAGGPLGLGASSIATTSQGFVGQHGAGVIVRVRGVDSPPDEPISHVNENTSLKSLPLDLKSLARASQIDNIVVGQAITESEFTKKSKKSKQTKVNKAGSKKNNQQKGDGDTIEIDGQDTDDGVIKVEDQQKDLQSSQHLPDIAPTKMQSHNPANLEQIAQQKQRRIDELMSKIERSASPDRPAGQQEAYWPISQQPVFLRPKVRRPLAKPAQASKAATRAQSIANSTAQHSMESLTDLVKVSKATIGGAAATLEPGPRDLRALQLYLGTANNNELQSIVVPTKDSVLASNAKARLMLAAGRPDTGEEPPTRRLLGPSAESPASADKESTSRPNSFRAISGGKFNTEKHDIDQFKQYVAAARLAVAEEHERTSTADKPESERAQHDAERRQILLLTGSKEVEHGETHDAKLNTGYENTSFNQIGRYTNGDKNKTASNFGGAFQRRHRSTDPEAVAAGTFDTGYGNTPMLRFSQQRLAHMAEDKGAEGSVGSLRTIAKAMPQPAFTPYQDFANYMPNMAGMGSGLKPDSARPPDSSESQQRTIKQLELLSALASSAVPVQPQPMTNPMTEQSSAARSAAASPEPHEMSVSELAREVLLRKQHAISSSISHSFGLQHPQAPPLPFNISHAAGIIGKKELLRKKEALPIDSVDIKVSKKSKRSDNNKKSEDASITQHFTVGDTMQSERKVRKSTSRSPAIPKVNTQPIGDKPDSHLFDIKDQVAAAAGSSISGGAATEQKTAAPKPDTPEWQHQLSQQFDVPVDMLGDVIAIQQYQEEPRRQMKADALRLDQIRVGGYEGIQYLLLMAKRNKEAKDRTSSELSKTRDAATTLKEQRSKLMKYRVRAKTQMNKPGMVSVAGKKLTARGQNQEMSIELPVIPSKRLDGVPMAAATRLLAGSNASSQTDIHHATADDLIAHYLGKQPAHQTSKILAKPPAREDSTNSDMLLQIESSLPSAKQLKQDSDGQLDLVIRADNASKNIDDIVKTNVLSHSSTMPIAIMHAEEAAAQAAGPGTPLNARNTSRLNGLSSVKKVDTAHLTQTPQKSIIVDVKEEDLDNFQSTLKRQTLREVHERRDSRHPSSRHSRHDRNELRVPDDQTEMNMDLVKIDSSLVKSKSRRHRAQHATKATGDKRSKVGASASALALKTEKHRPSRSDFVSSMNSQQLGEMQKRYLANFSNNRSQKMRDRQANSVMGSIMAPGQSFDAAASAARLPIGAVRENEPELDAPYGDTTRHDAAVDTRERLGSDTEDVILGAHEGLGTAELIADIEPSEQPSARATYMALGTNDYMQQDSQKVTLIAKDNSSAPSQQQYSPYRLSAQNSSFESAERRAHDLKAHEQIGKQLKFNVHIIGKNSVKAVDGNGLLYRHVTKRPTPSITVMKPVKRRDDEQADNPLDGSLAVFSYRRQKAEPQARVDALLQKIEEKEAELAGGTQRSQPVNQSESPRVLKSNLTKVRGFKAGGLRAAGALGGQLEHDKLMVRGLAGASLPRASRQIGFSNSSLLLASRSSASASQEEREARVVVETQCDSKAILTVEPGIAQPDAIGTTGTFNAAESEAARRSTGSSIVAKLLSDAARLAEQPLASEPEASEPSYHDRAPAEVTADPGRTRSSEAASLLRDDLGLRLPAQDGRNQEVQEPLQALTGATTRQDGADDEL